MEDEEGEGDGREQGLRVERQLEQRGGGPEPHRVTPPDPPRAPPLVGGGARTLLLRRPYQLGEVHALEEPRHERQRQQRRDKVFQNPHDGRWGKVAVDQRRGQDGAAESAGARVARSVRGYAQPLRDVHGEPSSHRLSAYEERHPAQVEARGDEADEARLRLVEGVGSIYQRLDELFLWFRVQGLGLSV